MSSITDTRKLIEEMNRYYEARALWHDQYMGYESIESMEQLLSPIIETLEEIIIGKCTLEIACGTGNWTQVLAKRASSVVAIDISYKALEIAKKKLSGYSNVSIIQGDAYDLSNVKGSYELVFAADWWSHIPRRMIPAFLKSVYKKLRPEATFILIDMSITDHFRQEVSLIDRDGNRISLRKLPDGSEFRVVKNFPSEEELRTILRRYGREILYREFDSLKRWMVILNLAQSC